MSARYPPLPARAADAWHPQDTGDRAVDVVALLQLLRRRKRLAIVTTALITAVAAVIIAQLPDEFTAEALVMLDARPSKIAQLQSPVDALLSRTPSDLSIVRTEIDQLTSPEIYRSVVDRLALGSHPAIVPPPTQGLTQRLLAGPRTLAGEWLGWPPPTDGAPGPSLSAEVRRESATERLGRMVAVVNEGGSYTFRVRVKSREPELAAEIANGIAAAYLESQRRQKADDLRAASTWLAERMGELRATALGTDEAAERFRADNQLGSGDEPSQIDSRVAQVNAALVAANARYSRVQADFAEADATAGRRGGDTGSAGPVLASPTIQSLRGQEAGILVERGQLLQVYLPRHPAVLETDAQLAAVRAKIQLEVDRIVAGLRGQVSAARREIDDLGRQLAALDERRSRQADAQVRLAELEREARANRQILDQFLQQFSTTLAQETGQQADARLIAAARPPLRPSGPRRKLLLAGATVGAAALGVALALAVGLRRNGLSSRVALEQRTGLPTLELVPEFGRGELRQLLQPVAPPDLTNAIRSLVFTLEASAADGPAGRVILVTSSVAGEGKSVLCLALAHAFARHRRRTVLVDLDFWRPAQARMNDAWGAGESRGRLAVLSMRARSPEGFVLAAPDRAVGVHERADLVRDVLSGLDGLRAEFDIILLDAPPVLAIPEVLTAAKHADATLLAVRFEGTSGSEVEAAIGKLARVGVRPLGTVLSRVHRGNYRRYGYGEVSYTRAG